MIGQNFNCKFDYLQDELFWGVKNYDGLIEQIIKRHVNFQVPKYE